MSDADVIFSFLDLLYLCSSRYLNGIYLYFVCCLDDRFRLSG